MNHSSAPGHCSWSANPLTAAGDAFRWLVAGPCPVSVHGHLFGALPDREVPVDELRERLGELDRGKPVYVICQSGLRSYIACRILAGNGFECYNFSGGFRFYDAVMNDRCLIESATACGMDK